MPYSREISIRKSIDWLTIGLYVALMVLGWISVYGASYDFEHAGSIFDFSQRYGKQLLWVALAGFIGLCILFLDNRLFNHFAYHIYLAFVVLLLVTIVLATEIKGSRSWLVFGPVSIQPAEFAKFATALALAKFMSDPNFQFNGRNSIMPGLIVFVPFVIIVLQNETGSALVYLAFVLAFYRQGMSGFILALGFWAALLFILCVRFVAASDIDLNNDSLEYLPAYGVIILVQIVLTFIYEKRGSHLSRYFLLGYIACFALAIGADAIGLPVNYRYVARALIGVSVVAYAVFSFWHKKINYLLIALFVMGSVGYCYSVDYIFNHVLQPHQQTRIKESLGIENDPSGAGYNVNQSKIAIGSGGFSGKGLLNGTQTKLKYVPEQDTDFIFCTVGEELGFWGTSLVLCLFAVLILRVIFLAERQRLLFARIYGYCVASILFFHVAINVGMVIGITPVIGIPLPFFSYGGSSLWGFTVLLFVFLRMDASREENRNNW